MSILHPLSCLQECRGQGPGLACVPVPCDVSPCPWTLPTARWALVVSRNTSDSLDIAIAALQQQQQLVQGYRGHGWKSWGSHRGSQFGHRVTGDTFHI